MPTTTVVNTPIVGNQRKDKLYSLFSPSLQSHNDKHDIYGGCDDILRYPQIAVKMEAKVYTLL